MTNALKIAEELERPCSGDHRHVVIIGGGRVKRAKVYPGELCKTIICGLRNQMVYDGRLENGLIGAVGASDEMKEFVLKVEDYENFTFYDDVSEKGLPKDLSMKARQTEMKQVYAHKVYRTVPLQECYDVTGEEPIGTKWLEVSKGDEDESNIKRLD